MPGSVHRRAFGQGGLGSSATQLMRAVSQPLNGELDYHSAMNETIEIHFQPVRADYVQVTKARMASWIRFGLVVIVSLAILVPLSSSVVFGARIRTLNELLAPICFPLIPAAIVAIVFWVTPLIVGFRTGRQVDSSPQMRSPTVWRFGENGVEIQTDHSQASMKWAAYSSVVEIERHYLLVHTANKNFVHFIAKRAFETREQEIRLREILERQLGPIKDEVRLKKVTMPLVEIVAVGGLFLAAVASWLLLAWQVMR